MLSDEEVEKLIKAGQIARVVREEAVRRAKPGMKVVKLAELIENRITELGGKPAFPVNIGINDVAAHYTPLTNDPTVIPEHSVLKIDIGVHVDGYIADTAASVSFSPIYDGLVEAARKALERALEVIKPGIRISEIGKVIDETIKSMGYKTVKNLSGHSIDRFSIHSGRSIPNYHEIFNRARLVEGAYAIEPFASTGIGFVRSIPSITIYSLRSIAKKRLSSTEKKLVDSIWSERRTLPFCERWYTDVFGSVEEVRSIIRSLHRRKVLQGYPILVERSRGYVSQFEHTIIVWGKDVIVTTM